MRLWPASGQVSARPVAGVFHIKAVRMAAEGAPWHLALVQTERDSRQLAPQKNPYLLSNLSNAVPMSKYGEALTESLQATLQRVRNEMNWIKGDSVLASVLQHHVNSTFANPW